MVAQLSWESICLTSRGSQVRALQRPPYLFTAWQFSWLERQPVTLEVDGSSPFQVAIFLFIWLDSSVVEQRIENQQFTYMPLQLSWQSKGLKILVSLVRFQVKAPFYNNLRTIKFVSCLLYIKLKYSLSGKENIFQIIKY